MSPQQPCGNVIPQLNGAVCVLIVEVYSFKVAKFKALRQEVNILPIGVRGMGMWGAQREGYEGRG